MTKEFFCPEQAGFYKPYKDLTGKIDLMRYCNHNLSYGYNETKGEFYLCESPTLESVTIRIISTHENFQDMREAFMEARTL